jgi:CheY-like chemotaxis protein
MMYEAENLYTLFVDRTEPRTQNRILVVEDDPFWQKVIGQNIFRTEPHSSVNYATSAEQALAILGRDDHFDLIVADQYLEGNKTGCELWRECKSRGITAPFLLTSGNVDVQDFPDVGVPFIHKPYVPSELRRTLGMMLEHRPAEGLFPLSLPLLAMTFVVFLLALYSDYPVAPSQIIAPPNIVAPPPPIKAYKETTKIAMASPDFIPKITLRTSFRRPIAEFNPFHYQRDNFFTPQFDEHLDRIILRAEEILSSAYLLEQYSDLQAKRVKYDNLER